MSDKEKAFKKTLEAIMQTEPARQATNYARKKLSDLGMTRKEMAYAAALAKAARDKSLEYEFEHGDFRISPKIGKDEQSIGIFFEKDF